LRHYATSWKIVGSISDEVTEFINWPNPCSRTVALGSTQPPTEISARNFHGVKGRPAHKADNLIAICELTVLKMWELQRFTTLWASTACYKDSFIPLAFTFCQLNIWNLIPGGDFTLCHHVHTWLWLWPSLQQVMEELIPAQSN
jgi:hypothetical protein